MFKFSFVRSGAIVVLSIGVFLAMTLPVSAQFINNSTTNTKQQTGDPQTNVSSNLQTARSGLQPTNIGLNNANSPLQISNTTSLTVGTLNGPKVKVPNTLATTSTSYSQTTPIKKKSYNLWWLLIAVVGGAFMAVTYWQFNKTPKKSYEN